MQPTDDSGLLRQYTENHSDEAFAALVTRHINLVYSVALRCVGDPHQAEEVAQAVFILLAKKAAQLRHDKALSSWLFQATRFMASNFIRGETRRHRRELEAHMQSVSNDSGSDLWRRIAPLLDDAVAGLNENERHAIVLRFYEGRNLREVGAALGASEDAAEKRVSRAVEKLRTFFAERGVTIGANGLVVVISANAVQAAPIGLAVTISTAATLAGTTLITTATATATKAIAMTALQKTLVGAILVAAVGTGIYEARKASSLRNQVSVLEQQQAVLIEQLSRDRDETARQVAAARDSNIGELARLRGEVTRLRRDTQELARLNLNSAQATSKLPTVAAIVVTNTEPRVLSEDQVRAYIQIKVGDAYSRLDIDRDVRSLYGTGLFSSIRVIENSNELGFTLTYIVKEKTTAQATPQTFENQGMATPEAGLQTFLWAARNGDSNLVTQMLRWRKEKDDAVSDESANRITAAQARGGFHSISNLVAVRIFGKKAELPDTTRMRVEFNEDSGKTILGEIYMIRESGEWRPALSFSRREGSTTMSAQFLMPTTPELGPVTTPEPGLVNAVSMKTNFVRKRIAP